MMSEEKVSVFDVPDDAVIHIMVDGQDAVFVIKEVDGSKFNIRMSKKTFDYFMGRARRAANVYKSKMRYEEAKGGIELHSKPRSDERKAGYPNWMVNDGSK